MLIGSFEKTLDILQRTMDVTVMRRDVISNNIANSETPEFKRSTVNFESQLKKALTSETKPDFQAKLTHEKHIAFHKVMDYKNVNPRRQLDYLSTMKNNGNNVDIEQEMMSATSNQMIYELLAKSVRHQFNSINIVLK